MALPISGPLSLSAIQTEFGGTNPISLSEYYGAAAGIPASGSISIGDFYGATAVTPFFAGAFTHQDPVARTSNTVNISSQTLTGGSETSVQPFDTLCAIVALSNNTDSTFGTPAGWVKQADLFADDTNDTNVGVFTRKLGATVDTSVVFTWSSSRNSAITVFAVGGTGDTAPSLRTSQTGVNRSAPVSGAYTTTGTDSYVCFVGGSNLGNFAGNTALSAPGGIYTDFASIMDGDEVVSSGIAGFVNLTPASISTDSFGGGSASPTSCGYASAVLEFF